MKTISRILVPFLAVSLALAGCDRGRGNDRWATTENTSVKIDFDKVNEAYRLADGPEDFERRVNEIYEGDEVVSVAVRDADAKTQVVTGFFDRNASGSVDEGESIFTIRRDVTGEGTAQMQTTGFGPYAYYSSPLMSIAEGMLLGSLISSAFRPGYAPVYTRPYTTAVTRASDLRMQRQSYRAANPTRFSRPKASGSGRVYNGRSSGGLGGGRSSGGTRFGVRRRAGRKLVRLDA